MADRIIKPDAGNDLKLQNDNASCLIKVKEDGTIQMQTGSYTAVNFQTDGKGTVVADPTTALGISTKSYADSTSIIYAIALG